MKQIDAIIFDMDGVLVSNDCFLVAIKRTTERLLWQERGIRTKITDDTVTTIKNIPGFNNDWDTSYALIDLIGKGIAPSALITTASPLSLKTRQSKRYKKVVSFFQSVYRGNNFDGLIAREKSLIKKSVLKSLKKRYSLGIATGRPKKEAVFTAVNLGISPEYVPYRSIVGREDAPREKPFPDPLLLSALRMRAKNPVYVGDTINDVLAADRAGMPVIYVGKEAIGNAQIQTVNDLPEVL